MEEKRGYHLPYKIGLISTHGVGKSTLVYQIAGELKKRSFTVEVITEVAGELRKQGYPINNETNLPAQFSILLRQIEKEIESSAKEYKCDVIISERTVNTDNLVYLERACGPHPFIPHLKEFMKQYSLFFPYSRVYLLPMVGDLQNDGIRDASDKAFQMNVYDRLKKFLQEHNIDYIQLPVPEKDDEFREEWINMIVKNTIDDLGKMGLKKWIK